MNFFFINFVCRKPFDPGVKVTICGDASHTLMSLIVGGERLPFSKISPPFPVYSPPLCWWFWNFGWTADRNFPEMSSKSFIFMHFWLFLRFFPNPFINSTDNWIEPLQKLGIKSTLNNNLRLVRWFTLALLSIFGREILWLLFYWIWLIITTELPNSNSRFMLPETPYPHKKHIFQKRCLPPICCFKITLIAPQWLMWKNSPPPPPVYPDD